MTEPSQPMMSDVNDEAGPQHRELRPLPFSNSVWVLYMMCDAFLHITIRISPVEKETPSQ